MRTVFLCNSGLDGILTGVYDIYASRLPISECGLELEDAYEPELFCQYRTAGVSQEKALKVMNKLKSRISERACLAVYRASLSKEPKRAEWIFQFIRLGLTYGRRILSMMQEEAVYEIFRIDRCVGNEAHLLTEFLRFERLDSGIFYGQVGPENDVLELLAPHFSERFPDMDWVIFDENRKKAAFHDGRTGAWQIRTGVEEAFLKRTGECQRKDVYVDLWKTFFETISIEERKNPQCQRTHLPLRYRKYMTEFPARDSG